MGKELSVRIGTLVDFNGPTYMPCAKLQALKVGDILPCGKLKVVRLIKGLSYSGGQCVIGFHGVRIDEN